MTHQNSTYCQNLNVAFSHNTFFGDTQKNENDQKLRLDYYPFGSPMEGRTSPENGYRFGFNGAEKEDDIYGEGNAYDFGARIYDSRIGKFLSIDSKMNEIPFLSPYSYAANAPIVFIDKNGENFAVKVNEEDKTIVIVANVYTVNDRSYRQARSAVAVWNQQTTTYEGYSVSFQVNVIPPVNPSVEELQKKFPKTNFHKKNGKIKRSVLKKYSREYKKIAARDNLKKDPSKGNLYFGNEGPNSIRIDTWSLDAGENGLVEYVGGVAANGYYISMNTVDGVDQGEDDEMVTHEIAHLFGLDDEGGRYFANKGIMDYNILKISNEDLQNVVKYAVENNIVQNATRAKVTIEGCGDISDSPFAPIIEDNNLNSDTEIILPDE
ncbi:MAG: hypothetical protein PF481_09830 [Bacteroidales bacterium]|jgi:RHS repeat-associated protein|nr:hypothetical protein [Bacteroidales bacterium]